MTTYGTIAPHTICAAASAIAEEKGKKQDMF